MSTLELAAYDPTTVGPYRLRARLGSGGMGVVYLADGPDGSPVAVKCLPVGVGDEVRARLRREADYLAAVRHRRVAAFVDADVDAARPWIAMQYIAGPSLAQAAVPLGPAQIRHLADGLAEALAALHRQRLTHRDVKPGNIILTHSGPVLVDLGIASGGDLTSLTEVGMVVGTPEWMSPEQLTGYPTGPSTDIWGWACVLTYAATGRAPFGSGPLEALAYRIKHEQPDLRGLPEWLRGAVAVGLAKDARARPTATELAAANGIERVSSAVLLAPPAQVAPPPALHRPHQRAERPPLPPVLDHPLPPRVLDRPLPPGTAQDRRAEARRVKAAKRASRRRPSPRTPPPRTPAPQVAARPPALRPPGPGASAPHTSAPRPATHLPVASRRSPVRRLLRTVVVLLTVALVAVLVGIGAYACVWHVTHGGSWAVPFRRLRDRYTGS